MLIGGGEDVAVYNANLLQSGQLNFSFSLDGANSLIITDNLGALGTDTLVNINASFNIPLSLN